MARMKIKKIAVAEEPHGKTEYFGVTLELEDEAGNEYDGEATLMVMTGGTRVPERPATRSARRPDHPVVAPPWGVAFCHSFCWSECE